MSGESKLKVHLEFGEANVNLEGNVDEVFKLIVRFLTQVYPNLEVIRKIIYAPDYIGLVEELSDLMKITPEGPVIVSNLAMSARGMMRLALLGADVGSKLGILSRESLSSNELSKITGKAKKTIMNEIPKLITRGLIEKTSGGEYKITTLGIRRTENLIKEYKRSIKS